MHDGREKGSELGQERHEEQERTLALHGDLARDTSGQLQPRYAYMPWPVGRLAVGDFVAEPTLGAVAAEAVSQGCGYVHIRWRDAGPCTASVRYSEAAHLPLRGPARADRLYIRQGIDQATYQCRDLVPRVARLIAAHLHHGPRSEVYRFALDGTVSDGVFTELDHAVRHGRRDLRSWAFALARHCANRQHLGAVPGWRPTPETIVEPPNIDSTGTRTTDPPATRSAGEESGAVSTWPPELLACAYIRSETALRLLDAAFALGAMACGSHEIARAVTDRCAGG